MTGADHRHCSGLTCAESLVWTASGRVQSAKSPLSGLGGMAVFAKVCWLSGV